MIGRFGGEYHWLSNFHAWDDGYTAEHEFQARKASDPAEADWVREAPTAREAKRRGRQVQLRDDWEDAKVNQMREVLRIKFTDPELRAKLLATGDEELVEGNSWGDDFWGKVLCSCIQLSSTHGEPAPDCVDCVGSGWRGHNVLGRLLMEVREEIRGG